MAYNEPQITPKNNPIAKPVVPGKQGAAIVTPAVKPAEVGAKKKD